MTRMQRSIGILSGFLLGCNVLSAYHSAASGLLQVLLEEQTEPEIIMAQASTLHDQNSSPCLPE